MQALAHSLDEHKRLVAAKQNQELLLANHFKSINLGEPTGQTEIMMASLQRELMYKSRRQKLSDLEGNEEEEGAAAQVECSELNEVNDILEEDVDNSDLAQLLPAEEETRIEQTKKTSILLNDPVLQDPPSEAKSMSWILPLPHMDEHLGGHCLLSRQCCPCTLILKLGFSDIYHFERTVYNVDFWVSYFLFVYRNIQVSKLSF